MANNHESDTIKQQKKAREEFLYLKKMQSGEIEAGPKPSEVAIVPKTFSEKVSNIWYHYGKIIVISIFIFIALAIMVVQCCNRIEYDLQVVYFTYTVVPDTVTEKMADYFEQFTDDINGDGKINVAVINCSCNPNENNSAKLTKMQAIIVSEPKALLYITDDKSISYFDKIKSDNGGFFGKFSKKLSKEFYESCSVENFDIPENLTMNIRNTDGTQLQSDKNISKYLKASEKLFSKLK